MNYGVFSLHLAVVNGEKIMVEAQNVDPNCINASNPFHQCGDYCVKKTADSKKSESGSMIVFPPFTCQKISFLINLRRKMSCFLVTGRFAFPVLLKHLSPRSSSGRSDGSRSGSRP